MDDNYELESMKIEFGIREEETDNDVEQSTNIIDNINYLPF